MDNEPRDSEDETRFPEVPHEEIGQWQIDRTSLGNGGFWKIPVRQREE